MDLRRVVLAATCIAINIVLAKVANILSLPLYLDTPGTILAAALMPGYWAILVGAGTSIVGALTINGVWIFYIGTEIILAFFAILAVRHKLLLRWWTSLITGIFLGVVAALVSAPITVLVFGGVTVPGPTAINAILLAAGKNLWQSVLAGSSMVEMLDKPAAALLTWVVLKRFPRVALQG